jgi:ribosomal protein L3
MNKRSISEIAGNVAFELFVPDYVKVLRNALSDSQGDIKKAESKGVAELELEVAKQKIVMEFQVHKARVSQEIAIAERISTSDEVEIIEYYDISGKAQAGITAQESSITAGIGGEGRKVTHRTIKFSGFGIPDAPEINS